LVAGIIRLAHNQQRQPGGQPRWQRRQHGVFAQFACAGQRGDGRQRQGAQDGGVGRQHRRHIQLAGGLPVQLLAFLRLRLALPGADPIKAQPHMGVWVDKLLHQPGRGGGDGDGQLFLQLAHQRGIRRFTGLDLAAGEFPIAGVHLAHRARGQQKPAVGTHQHPGDHFNKLGGGHVLCVV
jgi:hypothetical protein